MYFPLQRTIARSTVFVALFPSLAVLAAQDGPRQLDPDTAPKRGQYVYDSFGHSARSGLSDRCVDTGLWDLASATVECDPNLFALRAAPKAHTTWVETPRAESAAASTPGAHASALHQNPAASVSQANADGPALYQTAGASPTQKNAAPVAGSSTSRSVAQTAVANAASANPEPAAGNTYSESVVAVPLTAVPAGGDARTQLPDEGQTPAGNDGILAEHRYDDGDGGGTKTDGILGASRYHDEYPATARDDGISALNQYHDEDGGAAPDDGISTPRQYQDGDGGVTRDDGIIAHSMYGNDDSGVASGSLPGQPKLVPQGNDTAVAVADKPQPTATANEQQATSTADKPQAITMLPVTITVEADPLFDFDQSTVRDDSRKRLDDLIQQLRGVTYGEVIVVGFADPIGTAIYNQSLSWRRAESVEQYLAKHGLPASRIRAEGRGETEEFATFDSCGGIRNEHAIACLQPDRRVEVTITAKRQP